jgi:hypothetical protein
MVLRALVAVAVAILLASCGAEKQPVRRVTDKLHGLSYELPGGWHRAGVDLTPHLVDPREELSVGTFPIRYRPGGCAHIAVSALEEMGSSGAFVTVQERGLMSGSFARRPARFGPDGGFPSEASGCVPGARFTARAFEFGDAGRNFNALVAFGPQTPSNVKTQAWQILDSLRVDPGVRPTWRASP